MKSEKNINYIDEKIEEESVYWYEDEFNEIIRSKEISKDKQSKIDISSQKKTDLEKSIKTNESIKNSVESSYKPNAQIARNTLNLIPSDVIIKDEKDQTKEDFMSSSYIRHFLVANVNLYNDIKSDIKKISNNFDYSEYIKKYKPEKVKLLYENKEEFPIYNNKYFRNTYIEKINESNKMNEKNKKKENNSSNENNEDSRIKDYEKEKKVISNEEITKNEFLEKKYQKIITEIRLQDVINEFKDIQINEKYKSDDNNKENEDNKIEGEIEKNEDNNSFDQNSYNFEQGEEESIFLDYFYDKMEQWNLDESIYYKNKNKKDIDNVSKNHTTFQNNNINSDTKKEDEINSKSLIKNITGELIIHEEERVLINQKDLNNEQYKPNYKFQVENFEIKGTKLYLNNSNKITPLKDILFVDNYNLQQLENIYSYDEINSKLYDKPNNKSIRNKLELYQYIRSKFNLIFKDKYFLEESNIMKYLYKYSLDSISNYGLFKSCDTFVCYSHKITKKTNEKKNFFLNKNLSSNYKNLNDIQHTTSQQKKGLGYNKVQDNVQSLNDNNNIYNISQNNTSNKYNNIDKNISSNNKNDSKLISRLSKHSVENEYDIINKTNIVDSLKYTTEQKGEIENYICVYSSPKYLNFNEQSIKPLIIDLSYYYSNILHIIPNIDYTLLKYLSSNNVEQINCINYDINMIFPFIKWHFNLKEITLNTSQFIILTERLSENSNWSCFLESINIYKDEIILNIDNYFDIFMNFNSTVTIQNFSFIGIEFNENIYNTLIKHIDNYYILKEQIKFESNKDKKGKENILMKIPILNLKISNIQNIDYKSKDNFYISVDMKLIYCLLMYMLYKTITFHDGSAPQVFNKLDISNLIIKNENFLVRIITKFKIIKEIDISNTKDINYNNIINIPNIFRYLSLNVYDINKNKSTLKSEAQNEVEYFKSESDYYHYKKKEYDYDEQYNCSLGILPILERIHIYNSKIYPNVIRDLFSLFFKFKFFKGFSYSRGYEEQDLKEEKEESNENNFSEFCYKKSPLEAEIDKYLKLFSIYFDDKKRNKENRKYIFCKNFIEIRNKENTKKYY